MLHMFCQSAQFRAVIADRALPEDLSKWYPILDRLIASSYKGTLDSQSGYTEMSEGVTRLEKQTRHSRMLERELSACQLAGLQLPPRFQQCGSLHLRGRTYVPVYEAEAGTFRKGRNSSVTYRTASGNVVAGRIRRIIRTKIEKEDAPATDDDMFLFLERYDPLRGDDAMADPYRHWPGLQATLHYNSFGPHMEIVRPSEIVGPVAQCLFDAGDAFGIAKETVVIVSLDRVSDVLHILCTA